MDRKAVHANQASACCGGLQGGELVRWLCLIGNQGQSKVNVLNAHAHLVGSAAIQARKHVDVMATNGQQVGTLEF